LGSSHNELPPPPLVVHLFYTPTCPDCHAVRAHLVALAARYPRLRLAEYDLSAPENVELMASFYGQYEVPEEKWSGTVAVFAGDRLWDDKRKMLTEIGPALRQLLAATQPGPTRPRGGAAWARALRLGTTRPVGAGECAAFVVGLSRWSETLSVDLRSTCARPLPVHLAGE